jgi:hypothetical protein
MIDETKEGVSSESREQRQSLLGRAIVLLTFSDDVRESRIREFSADQGCTKISR